jgi:hypothetical protein
MGPTGCSVWHALGYHLHIMFHYNLTEHKLHEKQTHWHEDYFSQKDDSWKPRLRCTQKESWLDADNVQCVSNVGRSMFGRKTLHFNEITKWTVDGIYWIVFLFEGAIVPEKTRHIRRQVTEGSKTIKTN